MNVYLDYNATTPVDPRVAEVAIPYLKKDSFGNPSSFHSFGRMARSAVNEAREKVAALINAEAESLIFTGSGSEGDNHAIKGAFYARRERGRHIITSKVEHPAVIGTCEWLERYEDAEVTYLGVDEGGNLSLEDLKAAIRPDTTLVTLMMANNETGVIFPIKQVVEICHAHDVWVHTDAVQAMAKVPADVKELGIDIMSFAGHKIYAPKGIGCTYIRPGVEINNLLHGGHQEWGLRAGTENVLGIVALGEACRLIRDNAKKDSEHMATLRDKLESGLLARIPYLKVNGDVNNRVCNTSNITFQFVEGEALLLGLDMVAVAVSSGSACATGSTEPSHVLRALGLPAEMARASLRFSLGRFTTEDEIDYVLDKLPAIVARLRSLSPIYPGDPA
jgi:cysteine desulfurase